MPVGGPEKATVSETADQTTFELYGTLASKMARMEELLNAINRFLGEPGFEDRLLTDAQEFQRLLIESRGLYPAKLPLAEQPWFDQAIDETATTSKELLRFLQANDHQSARQALTKLENQRQAAHVRFSH